MGCSTANHRECKFVQVQCTEGRDTLRRTAAGLLECTRCRSTSTHWYLGERPPLVGLDPSAACRMATVGRRIPRIQSLPRLHCSGKPTVAVMSAQSSTPLGHRTWSSEKPYHVVSSAALMSVSWVANWVLNKSSMVGLTQLSAGCISIGPKQYRRKVTKFCTDRSEHLRFCTREGVNTHASQTFSLIRFLCSVTLLVVASCLPRHGRLVLRPMSNEGVRHPVDLDAKDLALIAALVSLHHPSPPATGTARALTSTGHLAGQRCLVTHPRPPAGMVVQRVGLSVNCASHQ